MKNKYFAGFSLAPQIRTLISDALKEEYYFTVEELESHLRNK